MQAKIKENSRFAEHLNKYIANCNVENEEINVIPNRIQVCLIGEHLVILKETWDKWMFFPDSKSMKQVLKVRANNPEISHSVPQTPTNNGGTPEREPSDV